MPLLTKPGSRWWAPVRPVSSSMVKSSSRGPCLMLASSMMARLVATAMPLSAPSVVPLAISVLPRRTRSIGSFEKSCFLSAFFSQTMSRWPCKAHGRRAFAASGRRLAYDDVAGAILLHLELHPARGVDDEGGGRLLALRAAWDAGQSGEVLPDVSGFESVDGVRHASLPAAWYQIAGARARLDRPGNRAVESRPLVPELTTQPAVGLLAVPRRGCTSGCAHDLVDGLAQRLDLNAAQIRKDLAHFGEFGVRGVGYAGRGISVKHLRAILGLDRRHRVVIVGARQPGARASPTMRVSARTDSTSSRSSTAPPTRSGRARAVGCRWTTPPSSRRS